MGEIYKSKGPNLALSCDGGNGVTDFVVSIYIVNLFLFSLVDYDDDGKLANFEARHPGRETLEKTLMSALSVGIYTVIWGNAVDQHLCLRPLRNTAS